METDLQGSIERFTLPEILQLIATSRKSGTLGIQRDDSIVMIYFERGDVIYGYGPRQTYHLGTLLKEKGVITEEQLNKAIEIQSRQQNSKRLGEIMIARKYIDRADLENVVRRQVEELLFSLMAWQSGTFKFYENQFPTEEEITVRVSVENVILEGLRRADEQNFVAEVLSDPDTVFALTTTVGGRGRELSLNDDEWNVMTLIDGRRSVHEICRDTDLEPDRAKSSLAKLKLSGLVSPVPADEVKKSEPAYGNIEGMVNRLAGLFENYLTDKSSATNRFTSITTTRLE